MLFCYNMLCDFFRKNPKCGTLPFTVKQWSVINKINFKKGWIVHFQRSESTKSGSKAWQAQVYKCNFKNKESNFNGGFASCFFFTWLTTFSLSLFVYLDMKKCQCALPQLVVSSCPWSLYFRIIYKVQFCTRRC